MSVSICFVLFICFTPRRKLHAKVILFVEFEETGVAKATLQRPPYLYKNSEQGRELRRAQLREYGPTPNNQSNPEKEE